MPAGDIFSIRVAGNIVSPEALGSMEYGCGVAGAKVIVGHTRCGAAATIDLMGKDAAGETGQHIARSPVRSAVPWSRNRQAGDRSSKNEDFSIKVPN